MRLLLAVAYWSLFIWWNDYLSNTDQPGEIVGSLVALAGSIYLIYFASLASLELFLGPVRDYFDNTGSEHRKV